MKNIVLILLIAMVPFSTMAQKRSKKGKKVKTEKIVESNSSYDFMVITGNEILRKVEVSTDVKFAKPVPLSRSGMSKSKMKIDFDFGGIKTAENTKLMKNGRNYRTMAEAVNGAANNGWDFISSNLVRGKEGVTHFYYMKKNK
tara:strand:- start:216 stop:644 length:429 start_codon:yes stop_codon:yes gene_type:complete